MSEQLIPAIDVPGAKVGDRLPMVGNFTYIRDRDLWVDEYGRPRIHAAMVRAMAEAQAETPPESDQLKVRGR